ncbi:MAG: hypothetical protein JSU87_06510 [Gemmatimonadota bacterium]|nr:MAG: hypothetical protein JSU87_06510 [Gemmatimonadota bacterium]
MRRFDVTYLRYAPLTALLLLAVTAVEGEAQHHRRAGRGPRSVAGFQFMWAEPQGEFAYFVDNSFGIGAHGVFNLGRQSAFGIRLDGSLVLYGHEHYSQPLSPTIPRVWVDVTTDNIIASGFIGPQITAGHGALRPYVHGGFGFSYFSTYSSVHGDPFYDPIASSTHFDDWTPALTGGGGLYLALSRTVLIDLSAQYVHNGRVRYIPEGGVYEDRFGWVWYDLVESEADMWIWKLGLSFAIG